MPDIEVAIVSYETDQTAGAASPDALRFVVLVAIPAGAQIYFTDRAWNGSAFAAAGGGDGTFVYTTGVDVPAGTVITITGAQLTAAGITLSNGGETIYVYQGTNADTPTTFLFAADIADGNTTFNGSLAGTGLTVGVNAVAVGHDNARFVGQSTEIAATQLGRISTNTQWQGSDQDDIGGTTGYSEVSDTTLSGPLINPHMQIFSVMAGGGQSDAILRVDGADGASVGTNLARLFRDNVDFHHLSDLTFDVEAGFFFFVDSDGNAVNRIMRGNISDLANGTADPTFTEIFATDGFGEIIPSLEINTTTNKIYWMDGDIFGDFDGGFQLWEANYDGTGARLITTLDTENVDPDWGFPGGVGDFVVYNTGNVAYVVHSVGFVDGLGNAAVNQNHILQVDLTTGAVTVLDVGSDATPGYNPGRLDPAEGQIIGIDVDQRNGDIYFITQPISADDSGGIFRYVPGTDTLTELWNQPTNNTHNTLQTFPTSNMTHIEFDEVSGRYFVSATSDVDTENDGSPGTNESDASIFVGNPAGGAPTLFIRAYEPTANGAPQGMEINYAPTISVTDAGSTYTEGGASVAVFSGSTIADPDQAIIKGAVAAITGGFIAGVDTLSLANAFGITGSWNATTGVLTLTGDGTYAQYQSVLNSVRFAASGDNPTAYGDSTVRTVSVSVTDGLVWSGMGTSTVDVTGINDAPVNVVGAAASGAEDSALAITGVSISDADADPATGLMTVTLTVPIGTLDIRTDVAGGLTVGMVAGDGTGTIVITATQNQINATLANATGLMFSAPANFNGSTALTVTTNDNGLTGNDAGLTGTGTTEEDSNDKTITVTAVNDAPVMAGDGTEAAAAVTEDAPSGLLTQTISSLFSGQFSDAADQVSGGSSANAFAGVAVIVNGSDASGTWQYWNGSSWLAIGASSTASATTLTASTPIRFSPASNFNGPAPGLTVVLVDDSGGALTNGGHIDVTTRGGATAYSSGTVVLSQPDVTAVNDAPTVINGATTTLLAVNEDAANPAGDTVANLFGSHFSDAADAVSGGSSANAFSGIMIGVNNSNASQGVWQVFTGGVWTNLPALSPTNTYLVSASDSLRFVPAADYSGTPGGLVVLLIDNSAGAVVTGTRLDSSLTGSGGSTVYSNGTVTLGTSITAVNDAPVAASGDTPTYNEGGPAVVVSANLTLSDVDTANMTGAIITISDFIAGDVLTFVNQNGISGVYDSGTGVLTLTGAASVANYQAALRSITYSGAADANVGGTDLTRTVSFVVTDGTEPSAAVTATVTIDNAAGPTAGDDDLDGTAGDDSISGLAGEDTIDGGDGDDYIDGGDDNDVLIGGAGNDYLKGGLGADAMSGGTGNDTYIVDNLGDTTDETGGDGIDLVRASISWTIGADIENLDMLSGGGAINGTGNELDNVLTGNSYDNILSGLAGADTLIGGGGDDVLDGGEDDDDLDGGNGDDQLFGGAGADDLIGGAGHDLLDGGAGGDDMVGGLGNDIYVVDDVLDTVTEAANGGTDTVQASISYSLGANVEHLTLTGSGDIDGTGNSLRNTLTGNNGANTLNGGDEIDTINGGDGDDVLNGDAGNDVLNGGADNDRLTGGAGSDKLTGGTGADTFVFIGDDVRLSGSALTPEKDQILDLSFAAGDVIDLSAAYAGTLAFTAGNKFTGQAGELVLKFNAGKGLSTLEIDIDGDGKADLRIEINGDVTGTKANLYTGGGDGDGGWVL